MAQETSKGAVAEEEYRIPPYFDRYQEEREKRYQSELHRVEEGVRRNGERIGELGKKMDRQFEEVDRRFTEVKENMDRRFEDVDQRFTEVKEEMDRRFEGVDRRFTEVKENMDRRFTELKEDMNRRFDQQGTWIKFTFGILSTGIVAILVKLFVK